MPKQEFIPAPKPKGPSVIRLRTPWTTQGREFVPAKTGQRVSEFAPKGKTPFLCWARGEWLLQRDWSKTKLKRDDVVIFVPLPAGGGGNDGKNPLVTVLAIVLIVVGAFTSWSGGASLIQAGAALLAGQIAIALVGLPSLNTPGLQSRAAVESPSYPSSVALAGNRARLTQPIPVIYGRHKVFPDFAQSPYYEFDATGEQYYYGLFCVGMGEYDLESIFLDDTPISTFQDVQWAFLNPGQSPTLVTKIPARAAEVGGQDVDNTVDWVGPFVICGPDQTVDEIQIDVVLPRGLYATNSTTGALINKTVTWEVEYQEVDASGTPVGGSSFLNLGTETLTLNTVRPVRRSYNYAVTSGRYQVRMRRTTAKADAYTIADDLSWAAMTGFLDAPMTLNSKASFIEVKIRATDQLTQQTSQRFACIVNRKLETWAPGAGWSDPLVTRNPVWAFCDALRNPDYGIGISDSRLNLDELHALAAEFTVRRDRFDAVFDKKHSLWEALFLIMRSGRATPLLEGGTITAVRDDIRTIPAMMWTPANIVKDSLSIGYTLTTGETPDGITIEYWDQTAWAPKRITKPLPGVVTPAKPLLVQSFGIVQPEQAEREALYVAANALYRRKVYSWKAEMEGLSVRLGDLVYLSHDIPGKAFPCSIVFYGPFQRVTLDEPVPDDMTGSLTLYWTNPDGSPESAPISFNGPAGNGDRQQPYIQGGTPENPPQVIDGQEYPKAAVESTESVVERLRITSIRPRSDTEVDITAVVEDNRVHEADDGIEVPDDSGGLPATDETITVTTDQNDLNLFDLYESTFGTPAGPISCTFIIRAHIGASSTSAFAIDTGTPASGSEIVLRIEDVTQGAGGTGGTGGSQPATNGGAGGAGGVALKVRVPITLATSLGSLWGGGGGGGGGGWGYGVLTGENESTPISGGGGGGGAGKVGGTGGSGVTSGQTGASAEGGNGGSGDDANFIDSSTNGRGGKGGGPGLAGNAGANAQSNGGAGGQPGAAIDGVSLVTYFGPDGDIRGPRIN